MVNLSDAEVSSINLLLSSSHFDLTVSRSSPARVFTKANIRGISIFSRENKRVKRRNSFTVSYSNMQQDFGRNYALVDRFVSVCGHNLAFVTELVINCAGLPILASVTAESKACLFDDYLAYDESDTLCIFANQIETKYVNLSTGNWKLLTKPVNDIECE